MILLTEPFGNHSNRLFQAIHIEAWCLENDIPFYNLCFNDMKPYYEIKSNCASKSLFLLNKLSLLRFFPLVDLEKCGGKIVASDRTIRVKGWAYDESNILTEKYRPYFQKKYALREDIANSNSFISNFNVLKQDHVVVGIHVRRGDYKIWCDGKYYFDDNVYSKCIDRMKALLAGNKCVYIIFSNEDVSLKGDEIITSKNDWYIDHYLMSRCDYLIGPPSTFTMWASYIGEVPLYHITSDSISFNLDDFTVCGG